MARTTPGKTSEKKAETAAAKPVGKAPKAAARTPAKAAGKQAAKVAVKNAAPVKTAAASAPAKPAGKASPQAPKPPVRVSLPERTTELREKVRKPKLVRDSFTMPEAEYAVLGEVKKSFLKAGLEVKKSELLRVGVALIRQMDVARLKEILDGLPTLKAGRPKKGK